MRRALAITLALFAILYAVARIRYAPPAPIEAADARFSASRGGRDVLQRLVGDGEPRVVGARANLRARLAVEELLRELVWSVTEQKAMACTHHGACAQVTNVIAELAGREPALPIVLLTAHHDSVPVSPGAGDDGLGVAALLETARALGQGPRPRRTIAIVLTDAEEAGLLGASAFVGEHPLARSVFATINVDARGTRGPSQMFETSSGNAWLVDLLAAHVARPVTTSLFYEVYRRMPNDTDFTLTKTVAGGVNFANVAGIEHYHTPLDALDHVDLGTLQQHGDNVLAMTRAFAELEGRPRIAGDAVWFDVYALGIVRWPAGWAMLVAGIALALVLGQGIRARAFDAGLAVFLPAAGAALVLVVVVERLVRALGALPAPFVAQPLAVQIALGAAAAGGALGLAGVFARRSSVASLWLGTWLAWGMLGVVVARIAPGASYLFVVPTAVAALSGPALTRPKLLGIACAAPAVAAAVVVVPLAVGLYDALGFMIAPLAAVPALLLATTLAPMLRDGLPRPVPLVLIGVSLASAIVAAFVPKFTAAVPERANVVLRQDERSARVYVDTTWGAVGWGPAPPAMLAALGGTPEPMPALPWTMPAPSVEVPRMELAAPTAEVQHVEDGNERHRVRLRLRSSRGAPTLLLAFGARRHVEVRVEGQLAFPRRTSIGSMLVLHGVPSDGVVVTLDADGSGAIPFTLLDRSPGVAADTKAGAAVRARSASAVPFQDGDVTVVSADLSR